MQISQCESQCDSQTNLVKLWSWQPTDTIGKCDTKYNSQCGSQCDSQGESKCDSQTNLVKALVLATNIYNWKKTDFEYNRLEKKQLWNFTDCFLEKTGI